MANKAGFDFRVAVDRDEVNEMFAAMESFAQNQILQVMQEVMKSALDHADKLLDALIYSTDPQDRPSMGFYTKDRTGRLRRSVSGFVRREGRGVGLYLFNRADYAKYNELGTFASGVTVEEIQLRAEAAALKNKDLVLVEYTPGRGGLEPRPHIIPTLVFIEFHVPDEINDWFRGRIKGFMRR